jgi:hypothetical protein
MCRGKEVLNTPPREIESADNSRALLNSRLDRLSKETVMADKKNDKNNGKKKSAQAGAGLRRKGQTRVNPKAAVRNDR